MGVASSSTTLFRTLGGSFGVAIMGALFNHRVQDVMAERAGALGSKVTEQSAQLDAASLAKLPAAAREAYQHAVAVRYALGVPAGRGGRGGRAGGGLCSSRRSRCGGRGRTAEPPRRRRRRSGRGGSDDARAPQAPQAPRWVRPGGRVVCVQPGAPGASARPGPAAEGAGPGRAGPARSERASSSRRAPLTRPRGVRAAHGTPGSRRQHRDSSPCSSARVPAATAPRPRPRPDVVRGARRADVAEGQAGAEDAGLARRDGQAEAVAVAGAVACCRCGSGSGRRRAGPRGSRARGRGRG